MSDTVKITRDDGIAVLTLDNPPVNALGHALRAPLFEALQQAKADDAVQAIVITCAGRTFIAGADISEFGKPPKEPSLPDLIAMLESIDKPTVAAIHGTALGGGLELALGCHYRVADKSAMIGLPEVNLGLIPGAGGTVRLPRLVGPEAALKMIVSGKPIGMDEAVRLGAVDRLAETDLLAEAIAFAREKAASGKTHPHIRARAEKLAVDLAAFDEAVRAVTKKARGLTAPHTAAEAVRNAITMEFDAALDRERELFLERRDSAESAAQRHLFFATREATKVLGVGRETEARKIARAGVIGAGTMGAGIAMALANGGIPVTILEMNEDAIARGLAHVEKTYAGSVKRGSIAPEEKEARIARISGTTDYADLSDCDIVIEAVFEDMGVKRQVFTALDSVLKPGAILASNTSYLDVNEIAATTKRPQDVVGLHFFSPAHVMKLLEIVRGDETAPEVIKTALTLARKIGKVPVVVGVCNGFVGNRMLAARREQNEDLLLSGATPEQVDRVFTDFGWPMGPFQMVDLAGLDISWKHRQSLGLTAPIADTLCEAGHFGQKAGRGFYLYEEGSRTPKPDPFVQELIEKKAVELGVERREISADEITERTLYPMINEGAKILEERIAARASDIDVVWVNGYGFPVAKGGPMFWAERFGIKTIVERLEHWHQKTGNPLFEPAPLLRQLALTGGGFADLA
ncbi:enoyl-CoA hydratase/isomerase family protein [Nitratireductor aquimarinus]|uniref:3-hydroxyacyl-CoA dehydrogenase NAD-binding domain-containing protein n=1 Tax=Nitratireductor TaxID=245876 RepID=UPI0019D33FE6|nr:MULTISPECIES: 3-hydroxyacyl-CoA dehydrogenase NAD-binding domain-containing protein [Nitratireductor]MBN7776046.1 enoyl-CoA hydratase/isomerase family protein [Nitratireductor pacificus]MBN7780710.1 enoyl-CoA hydratase/isomerase family protein [Nitratireductor pacificus]MBN7789516.1 enoyl-CoA hydratase/isomerase family protein [Nitratireductor aquimarinus]MBY6098794.1 enoyl-CoA hydratase/isomerase family protein [Nitratireductor aquimarinus]MCA1263012.1 enoyl-CoA hydratase/isomerase family 